MKLTQLLPSLLCSLAGLASLAPAQQEEVTLESLQAQIDSLRAELQDAATKGGEPSVRVFGRVHADTWAFATPEWGDDDLGKNVPVDNTSFLRRARFGMSGKMGTSGHFKSEVDFGSPDNLAMKDVYVGLNGIPILQTVRVGNQKRPYGLDHLNSSNSNVFIERPFVVEGFNQDARRLGAAAYGVSADQSWNWRYGLYFMDGAFATEGRIVDDNADTEVAARLARTVWYEDGGRNYLHLAVAGSLADIENGVRYRTRPESRTQGRWLDANITDAESAALAGVEAVWNQGPTQVTAEWMQTSVGRTGGQSGPSLDGGYVYVSHYLTGEFMPWKRKTGILGRPEPNSPGLGGAWQVALRYSWADFTDGGIEGGAAESVTLGLNWLWTAHSNLQLNYIRGSLSERDEEGDYDMVGFRLRYDF